VSASRCTSPTDAALPVAELYRELSGRLEQIVRFDVRAPESVIEEACQFAWGRLMDHRHRVRRESALSWLARTAVREAFKLRRREGVVSRSRPRSTASRRRRSPRQPDLTSCSSGASGCGRSGGYRNVSSMSCGFTPSDLATTKLRAIPGTRRGLSSGSCCGPDEQRAEPRPRSCHRGVSARSAALAPAALDGA